MDETIRDSFLDGFTRLLTSLEDLSKTGVDPVAMLILFLIGLYLWTNYRITMSRLKKKYRDEYGHSDSDQQSTSGSGEGPLTAADLIPFMNILSEYANAVKEMAGSLIANTSQLNTISDINAADHKTFRNEAVAIKSSIGSFNTALERNKQEILGSILGRTENVLRVGISLFDSNLNLIGWNKEGKDIFSSEDKKATSMIGKRIDSVGSSHRKCLGNNKPLAEVMEISKNTKKTQIDILELSVPSTDQGKWNWYLTFILPFLGSVMLLMLEVGDVHRGPIEKQSKTKLKTTIVVEEDKKIPAAKKNTEHKAKNKKVLIEKEVKDDSKTDVKSRTND